MLVLVIEDSSTVRKFLNNGMTARGHTVVLSEDLESARKQLSEHANLDLLIVDRILPDGDGLDLVRELRRNGDNTPAICLTSRSKVEERIDGLRSGVDDYLVKPFSFDELLARVDAVMRRAGKPLDLKVGPLSLNIDRHRVELENRVIDLTAREFSMLTVLARNVGKVLSREQLLSLVWGIEHDPQTNVVDVYIRYLRAKLGDGLIYTVRGVGYTLDPSREP